MTPECCIVKICDVVTSIGVHPDDWFTASLSAVDGDPVHTLMLCEQRPLAPLYLM